MDSGVAIVTGGSEGIGYAIAEMFVRRGFSVAICARRIDLITEAADRLKELAAQGGNKARIFEDSVDLASASSARSFIERAAASLGGVDVLVNNAAAIINERFETISDNDLDEMVKVNVLATLICTKAALPYLIRSPLHALVNVSSEMDNYPIRNFVAYASTKGAVTSFTKALTTEYPPERLRTVGIRPRRVQTASWDRARPDAAAYYIPSDVAELVEYAIFRTPATLSGAMYDLKDFKQPV